MIRQKAMNILQYFEELYPDAHCELMHDSTFELVVAVMLSAQTTDEAVNRLTRTLFKKYTSIEDYANASIKTLEEDLKTIGLYRNKAKNLKALATKIIEDFNGEVPSDHNELVSLPGVGRKTANVVQSVAFDIPAFAVDTHVERIAKRLGFAKKDDSVLVVERKVTKSLPKSSWNKAHHQFIFFGRYFCKAINPNCDQCKLIDQCKEHKRIKKEVHR